MKRRVLTKAQFRERAKREGTLGDQIGYKDMMRHAWIIKQLVRKHGGKCVGCNEQVTIDDETKNTHATIDHVIPLSKGGPDTLANMALMCHLCNWRKGNKVAG